MAITISSLTPAARSAGGLGSVAAAQGLYFLLARAWPLVHIDSFLAVTGPKSDLRLVDTVGALIGVAGSSC